MCGIVGYVGNKQVVPIILVSVRATHLSEECESVLKCRHERRTAGSGTETADAS